MALQVERVVDADHVAHLRVAERALSLPIEASGLHWHPFGVYTVPLAKRREGSDDSHADTWSRRLHVWHPEAKPVGEASPYGVHTHTGPAQSHVLVGALHHHLYAFERGEGSWQEATDAPVARARLLAHVQETTQAGQTHAFAADQAHGVTKPPGLAVSLFEQRDGPVRQPFTTWQRLDVPAEALQRKGPVALEAVRREALLAIQQALFAAP